MLTIDQLLNSGWKRTDDEALSKEIPTKLHAKFEIIYYPDDGDIYFLHKGLKREKPIEFMKCLNYLGLRDPEAAKLSTDILLKIGSPES